jgi:hypothetical protein
MRRIASRLDRLERTMRPGACRACRAFALVTEDCAGNLLEGAYPEPCPRCGQTALVLAVRVPAGCPWITQEPRPPLASQQ